MFLSLAFRMSDMKENKDSVQGDLTAKYKQREQQFQDVVQAQRKRMLLIGFSRLAVFLLAIGACYLAFPLGKYPVIIIGVVGFAGFLYLVKVYERLKKKVRLNECLEQLNKDEQTALGGDFSVFGAGGEFNNPDHPYALDLDVFGNRSLFQFVNRTCTFIGKTRLGQWLAEPLLKKEAIVDRQEAVREVGTKLDWRQLYTASGKLSEEEADDSVRLLRWVLVPGNIGEGFIYKVLMIVYPIVSITILVLAIVELISVLQYLCFLAVPLVIIGLNMRAINLSYQKVSQMKGLLDKYATLLELIESEKFESPQLQASVAGLKHSGKTAGATIRELTNILSSLDNRNNVVVAVLLSILFLWDIQYMRKLQAWQRAHAADLAGWLETISEFDALVSLGTFHFNHPDFNFPEVDQEHYRFEFREAGHPMLQSATRVDNDFVLDDLGRFTILTGANMAGKSTFLRTIGINLILALAGAPVCAKSFVFHPIALYSSMRTSDSLQDHESYFFTELKRLKMIIDHLKTGEKMFILLDEILKGTNSEDKESGSRALIKQLSEMGAMGIVATHDLSLCRLEEQFPKTLRNQCFEVEIKGDQLVFDYRLRNGVCQNRNATFLMHQMGIIPKDSSDDNS